MSEALALSAFVTAVKSDSRRKRGQYRRFVIMLESLFFSVQSTHPVNNRVSSFMEIKPVWNNTSRSAADDSIINQAM